MHVGFGVWQFILDMFLPAAKPAGIWITFGLPSIRLVEAFRGQRSMASMVIEVTELNSDVKFDLPGTLGDRWDHVKF